MLSIFSYAYLPSVCLWWGVYPDVFVYFVIRLFILLLMFKSSLYILDKVLLQIFSSYLCLGFSFFSSSVLLMWGIFHQSHFLQDIFIFVTTTFLIYVSKFAFTKFFRLRVKTVFPFMFSLSFTPALPLSFTVLSSLLVCSLFLFFFNTLILLE